MPKYRSRRRNSRRNSRRQMKGGYTSAASYGMAVNGDTNAQYNRVFGPQYAGVPGNVIIGAQGQNIPSQSQIPTAANLALAQSAGKRRRHGGFVGEEAVVPLSLLAMQQTYKGKKGGSTAKFAGKGSTGNKRSRCGGFFTEAAINQAVVPFALVGMQQTYRRKRRGGKITRRHHKH
jgi:hypothetical protein